MDSWLGDQRGRGPGREPIASVIELVIDLAAVEDQIRSAPAVGDPPRPDSETRRLRQVRARIVDDLARRGLHYPQILDHDREEDGD